MEARRQQVGGENTRPRRPRLWKQSTKAQLAVTGRGHIRPDGTELTRPHARSDPVSILVRVTRFVVSVV